MPTGLTSDRVWKIVEKQRFAVLGTVSRNGRPLTTGIVYAVKDRHIYIPTNRSSQKAKNIQGRPHVSLCVTIEKRIPFLPWIKIPAATITFRGEAALLDPDEVEPRMRKRLTGRLKLEEEAIPDQCFVRVRPEGDFVTYGVGVPMLAMRAPERARGRVPV